MGIYLIRLCNGSVQLLVTQGVSQQRPFNGDWYHEQKL